MKQNRWKSPVLWGAIISSIVSVLIAADVFSPTQSDAINKLLVAVLQVFAAFGAVNNPENKDAL